MAKNTHNTNEGKAPNTSVKFPIRCLKLDPAKIREAQTEAEYITELFAKTQEEK